MIEQIIHLSEIDPVKSKITLILSEEHRLGIKRYFDAKSRDAHNPFYINTTKEEWDNSKLNTVFFPELGTINIEYK